MPFLTLYVYLIFTQKMFILSIYRAKLAIPHFVYGKPTTTVITHCRVTVRVLFIQGKFGMKLPLHPRAFFAH